MISILVVDDHTLVRQGIVGLLESQPDIEVIGQAGSAEEALAAIAERRPAVVLMDIAMPGIGGLNATREIRERFPDVQVVMLTIHEREDYLFQALRSGAAGYVLKGADVHDLLAAVRAAQRGEVYLLPGATKRLIEEYMQRATGGEDRQRPKGLSDREREILLLIAQGMTTPDIAAALYLSPHTVQSHRDHIMAKLDLHSKAALIRFAISRGLIEP